MPKLTKKSSKPAKPAMAPGAPAAKQSNPTLLIGMAFAVLAAILAFTSINLFQSKARVMVAKGSIAPYTTLTADVLQEVSVPKQSVSPADLTPDEFEDVVAKKQKLVTRVEVLPGQRIHEGAVSSSSVGTLSVVRPNETVVAVNATFSGTVGGAVRPGSVVDVFGAGGGGGLGGGSDETGALAENVKVLGVGVGAGAAAQIQPQGGEDLKEAKGGQGVDGGGNIVVVLAIPQEEVAAVVNAGQVNLALYPRKSFDINGTICESGKCAASPEATPQTGEAPATGETGTPATGETETEAPTPGEDSADETQTEPQGETR